MIGFDIMADDGRTVDPVVVKRVVERAADSGLILLTCGTQGEAIRILVPLTASDALIEEGLTLMERALKRDA